MTCKSTKKKEKPTKFTHMFLCKIFQAWRSAVQEVRLNVKDEVNKSKFSAEKALIPGVVGLRNLGNTCYMNSILQVLGHLDKFRHFFVSMPVRSLTSAHSCCHSWPHNQVTTNTGQSCSSTNSSRNRNTESLQLLRKCPLKGGLNGGATQQKPLPPRLLPLSPSSSHHKLAKWEKSVSLCEELRSLFQALWSGQSSVVSPNALLQAVWDYIPAFQGYSQQDAQEFLSELLDKVQAELHHLGYINKSQDVVTDTFQGELVSEITCLSCEQKFQTYEPFMDLSLEFPSRYQRKSPNWKIASNVCHITEMLSHFTKSERLDGRIYACDSCNGKRRSNSSAKIYTKIKKQFLLSKLPHVLRLHLKRFRWSKGNHREKIATHVSFDKFLNIQQFCAKSMSSIQSQRLYQLSAIIIHHGKGFGSGHYTAFCWSKEADSWILCNDTNVQQVPMKEVFKSQVYILIFSLLNPSQEPPNDTTTSTSTTTIPDLAKTYMKTTDSKGSTTRDSFTHILTTSEENTDPFNPSPPPPPPPSPPPSSLKTAVKSSPTKTVTTQQRKIPCLLYFESPYYTRSKSRRKRRVCVSQALCSSVVKPSSRKRKHKCCSRLKSSANSGSKKRKRNAT
ncbi:ubiquitin carboxyl-terminal hydrolase 44 [Octopus sinensis]|uniref:Ubiquitin carboxyl-terminal hydrolase n=1 Tax=Octopus sinensis TaxID=2607531 RepID=A0A7E6FL03_9MOLL|nr:ubiquitin carboxyl-terminal hydrolase 44 [Octopus sinensis]